MSDNETCIYADLRGSRYFVGRLWTHQRRGRESASFEYDREWLSNPERFALEPALVLSEGTFHTDAGKAMFGALGDSAPDRWGRVLMRRAETRRAKLAGEQSRTLREIDYLLGVNDAARQGALRFSREKGDEFLARSDKHPIPPLVALPKLLSASEKLLDDRESDDDLRLLLAPGSSLGGARPKASVIDNDSSLAIAKFPHKDDEFATVAWEAVALQLAQMAGIETPDWRLETIVGKQVLILRRFDRDDGQRIPFLSAMSMLGAKDNETHSYLEIVDALRQYGAAPKNDMAELWRRIIFSIMISNTDDHLRNHAFLYEGQAGWRLSPVYDLNPVPVEKSPRILQTMIDLDDGTCSLALALSVADEYGLDQNEAKTIAGEVASSTSQWRKVATDLGIKSAEITRMASAFEHYDLKSASAM